MGTICLVNKLHEMWQTRKCGKVRKVKERKAKEGRKTCCRKGKESKRKERKEKSGQG